MKKLLPFLIMLLTTKGFGQHIQEHNPSDFLPKGYVIFEKANGDLNKDGIDDCVLIIKGTDKSKIVAENQKLLDRNRRGIIILFKQKDHYELAVKNYTCFSSENEDGGVYFAPDLSINIKKGNLYINYMHGRYGYWQYTFRSQKGDFELIGYDESNSNGPVIRNETSINFLNKKKLTKENINENLDQESGQEHFKNKSVNIKADKLIKLSEVKDFDEFDMSIY